MPDEVGYHNASVECVGPPSTFSKMWAWELQSHLESELMSLIEPRLSGNAVGFAQLECESLGESFHREYVGNRPFPHIVLDNFLPLNLCERVVEEFPTREIGKFSDNHSRLKTGYQLEKIESQFITSLLFALNSAQMLIFLERLTGITGLISDPHYVGGGLHETARGGHLSIHADFNLHPKLKLRRRINLILFLNSNWNEDWGGQLELWERDMSMKCAAIAPLAGRAVIFNTDSDSFHGHPDPLRCPEDVYRRSIATYYYTAVQNAGSQQQHTTRFRARPNSDDSGQKIGARIKEVARDFMPPIIARRIGI